MSMKRRERVCVCAFVEFSGWCLGWESALFGFERYIFALERAAEFYIWHEVVKRQADG